MSILSQRCYLNPSPTFGPSIRVISAITNAVNASVTTTTNHNYVDGNIVRFYIPTADGMPQMDQLTSPIVVTGPTTFTTNIDSTGFIPFAIPVAPNVLTQICAFSVPIGELNATIKSAVVNIL